MPYLAVEWGLVQNHDIDHLPSLQYILSGLKQLADVNNMVYRY